MFRPTKREYKPYKTEYFTVSNNNRDDFDSNCNKLRADGWHINDPMKALVFNGAITYYQQWYKHTTIED